MSGRRLPASIAPLAAALLTFLVYVPSLGGGFTDWDDSANFVANHEYRGLGPANLAWMFTTFHAGHYQPLSWLTLGLDYAVWGMNPLGYHLGNAILHALAAAVLAGLAARLFAEAAGPAASPAVPPAWFGAAVALAWSLHPLRVEAVSWLTERREALCGLLTLLAVSSHVRGRPAWRTAVLAALAMLAKATAVTIPVLVVLVDLWRARPGTARDLVATGLRLVRKHAVLVALAAATSIVAVFAQRAAGAAVGYETLPLTRRLALTAIAITFGIWKTLWPSGLAPLHQANVGSTWEFHESAQWEAGIGVATLIAGLAAGWALRRRLPGLLALAMAGLVMILPAGGLGQSGPQTAAERYTYQPGWIVTYGLAWAAAAGVARLRSPGVARLAGIVAAGVIAGLAWLSIRQQACWHDSEALWLRQLEVYPASPTGNHHLGFWYLEHQPPDFEKAERYLRRAVAVAPAWGEPRGTLAGLLYSTGRTAEAIEVLTPVFRDPPEDPATLQMWARMMWETGRGAEALAALERRVAVDGRNPEAWRELAKAQAAAGRPHDAVATFEKGLAAAPARALIEDFAWLLASNPDSSVRNGRRAMELLRAAPSEVPSDAHAVVLRAVARAAAGQYDEAVRDVEAAIPGLPPESVRGLQSLLRDLAKRQPIVVEPRYP